MNFAQLLFPDFSLILIGYLLCSYTALNRSVWDKVELLVYYFLFPLLLFQSIVGSPLHVQAAAPLIAAGLLLGVCSIGMTYALPGLRFLRLPVDNRLHAASAQVAFRFNSFVALALAHRLAGATGVQTIAVLIGFCVPLFNIAAVWPMYRAQGAYAQGGFAKALLRNPLIIGTVSGLAFNLLGLQIPSLLEPTISRIGAASLSLGLMSAGAGMQFGSLARAPVLSTGILAIRHVLTPLCAYVLAHVLHLTSEQRITFLEFSALPTASTCYVLATRMGFDGPYVAGLVTLSTLLGMLSLPFALLLN